MATNDLPDPSYLRQLLTYRDGELIWNRRPLEHFKNAHGCNIWNAKNAGQRAGCIAQKYRAVRIDGRRYLEHRIVWAIATGSWPKGEIDHINGEYLDNRIENLNDVDRLANARNLSVRVGPSGHVGVSKIGKRWRASISSCDKTMYLGTFDNLEDAVAARKVAEAQLGYHPNHGRRAA